MFCSCEPTNRPKRQMIQVKRFDPSFMGREVQLTPWYQWTIMYTFNTYYVTMALKILVRV